MTEEDEVVLTTYDDYLFLSQYSCLEEIQEQYEQELDFFSVCILY